MGRYTILYFGIEISQLHLIPDPVPTDFSINSPLLWPWNNPQFLAIGDVMLNPWLTVKRLPGGKKDVEINVYRVQSAADFARDYFKSATTPTGRVEGGLLNGPGRSIWVQATSGIGHTPFLLTLSKRLDEENQGLDVWMRQFQTLPDAQDMTTPNYCAAVTRAVFGPDVPDASAAGVAFFVKNYVIPAVRKHWAPQVATVTQAMVEPMSVMKKLYKPISEAEAETVNVGKLQTFVQAYNTASKQMKNRNWLAYRDDLAEYLAVVDGLGAVFGFKSATVGGGNAARLPTILQKCLQTGSADADAVQALRASVDQYINDGDEAREAQEGDSDDETTPIDNIAGDATKLYDAMKDDALWAYLGFPDRIIPGLNQRVCVDPKINAWDPATRAMYEQLMVDDADARKAAAAVEEGAESSDESASATPSDSNVQPVVIFKHQLSAVAALVKWSIHGESGFNCDAVGLGKTIVAIVLFIVLNNYRDWYRKHGHFPGKFADVHHANGHRDCTGINATCKITTHLCGPDTAHPWCSKDPETCAVTTHRCQPPGSHPACTSDDKTCPLRDDHGNLPDWPFIVTAPPALVSQWVEQFWRFTTYGTASIIPYTSGTGSVSQVVLTHVKDPLGRFSRLGNSRMFLVASQSALKADFNAMFPRSTSGHYPVVKVMPHHDASIFGGRFANCFHDEVQFARNPNAGLYPAIFTVSRLSFTTVNNTATPVTKSAVDVMYLAAVGNFHVARTLTDWNANIQPVIGNLRSLERAVNKERGDIDVGIGLASRATTTLSNLREGRLMDSPLATVVAAAYAFGRQLRSHVIRRARADVSMHVEHAVPPSQRNDLILAPGAWEEAQLAASRNRTVENMAEARYNRTLRKEADAKRRGVKAPHVSARLLANNFYLHIRLASLHACLASDLTGVDKQTFPTSLEDFEDYPSVKLSTLVAIIRHHCRPDAKPLEVDDEGNVVEGQWSVPVAEGEKVRPLGKMDYKFAVYTTFTSALPLIQRVLAVHEINQVYQLSGELSADARRKNLDAFKSASGTAVMLLTSVAVAGLNLQEADVMILLDSNWSASFDTQLLGRICRQGQVCRTICYRLLTMFTGDYAILLIGGPKELLNMAVMGDRHALKHRIDGDRVRSREDFLEEMFDEMNERALSRKNGVVPLLERPPLALSSVPPQPEMLSVIGKMQQRTLTLVSQHLSSVSEWQEQVDALAVSAAAAAGTRRHQLLLPGAFDSAGLTWTLPIVPVLDLPEHSPSAATLLEAFQTDTRPLPSVMGETDRAFISHVQAFSDMLPSDDRGASLTPSPPRIGKPVELDVEMALGDQNAPVPARTQGLNRIDEREEVTWAPPPAPPLKAPPPKAPPPKARPAARQRVVRPGLDLPIPGPYNDGVPYNPGPGPRRRTGAPTAPTRSSRRLGSKGKGADSDDASHAGPSSDAGTASGSVLGKRRGGDGASDGDAADGKAKRKRPMLARSRQSPSDDTPLPRDMR